MSKEIANLKAELRAKLGTRHARALRAEGKIPCAIGAVGGPERTVRGRLGIGVISTLINLLVMIAIGLAVAWTSCSY